MVVLYFLCSFLVKWARFLRMGKIAARFCCHPKEHGEELEEVIVAETMQPMVDHLCTS